MKTFEELEREYAHILSHIEDIGEKAWAISQAADEVRYLFPAIYETDSIEKLDEKMRETRGLLEELMKYAATKVDELSKLVKNKR